MSRQDRPPVSICLLLFGDHFALAEQSIGSIRKFCPRAQHHLVVGANAIGEETHEFVSRLTEEGVIDRLELSPTNINKCPMMRRMFEGIETEFIWWFDDDSHFTSPDAFSHWLSVAQSAPSSTVMWGQPAVCHKTGAFTYFDDVLGFVREAEWFQGLPPPSWRPGGKGEFDFEGKGTGDGRWFFLVGGSWLIRTEAVRALDWPDRRLEKMGDDVFLGEAIRQQGWDIADCHEGVNMNTAKRRGRIG